MDGVPKLLLLLVVTATVTSHGDHDHSADSKQHIMEHLEQAIGGTYNDLQAEITEEEKLHFHWFRQHDYDGNKLLDGLELVHAISHFNSKPHQVDKEALIRVIDDILKSDDANNDGFLDYVEFIQSERHFF